MGAPGRAQSWPTEDAGTALHNRHVSTFLALNFVDEVAEDALWSLPMQQQRMVLGGGPLRSADRTQELLSRVRDAGGHGRDCPEGGCDAVGLYFLGGVVYVLQCRQWYGMGPLPLASLAAEFEALLEVPFSLAYAGEPDTAAFLRRWPRAVQVIAMGGALAVQLAEGAGTVQQHGVGREH